MCIVPGSDIDCWVESLSYSSLSDVLLEDKLLYDGDWIGWVECNDIDLGVLDDILSGSDEIDADWIETMFCFCVFGYNCLTKYMLTYTSVFFLVFQINCIVNWIPM